MEEMFSDIGTIEGLIEIRLSEREAKVCKVLLGMKEITASGILKFTDVYRRKVHEVLNALTQAGFSKEWSSESAGGRLHSAVDPKIALRGLVANCSGSGERFGERGFVEILRGSGEVLELYSSPGNSVNLERLDQSKGSYVMSQEERDLGAEGDECIIKSRKKMNVVRKALEIKDFGDNFLSIASECLSLLKDNSVTSREDEVV